MTGKHEAVIVNEIVQDVEARAERQVEDMKEKLGRVHNFGVMAGRVQAFKAMQLLSEYMAFKQIAQMIGSGDFKLIPGVTNIDSYFDLLGIKGSTGYNNLKIARALEYEEVQLLEKIGFTRRDLLGYASLPEEARLEIKGGKVINLETASKEEIKDLVEQVLAETRACEQECNDTVRAKDRVLKGKEEVINKQAASLAKYEKEADLKGYTLDEAAFLKQIEALRLGFVGYLEQLDVENLLQGYEQVTPRMKAAAISYAHYMKMAALAAYDTAVDLHGNPVMNPELMEDFERWQQQDLQAL